ncbi:MAG: phosphate ABC transporter permease PstA [Pyrinomonadaceae bacterium]|nr:phosphate ABC transporter permease PstA [Pyrinomonadaceae bacterium]MCX7639958.1 phosphate ABC transporter permease PstA [Pyrinomonadaceae bacterium]MDW8304130.1 phosphate ABC transporter permease PstA [Acidobacteriota bacterium]
MEYSEIIRKRKREDFIFNVIGIFCTLVGIVTLGALIVDLVMDGFQKLNWQFFTSYPSRFADKAGILSAWVGTLLVMLVTAVTAVPLGVAAGVYLEEYARRNWLTSLIEINIANLAGVPSIVYGLMALGLLVYQLQLGQSILTGGITLAFLILPIVIVSTREALRTIPQGIREAALALGSTNWQVVRHHLLPYATGGILTGVIIALSRAIGETAPLVTIGALTFIAFLPPSPIQSEPPYISFDWIWSPFSVLPIQMFNWVSRPDRDFAVNAAGAGLALITATLSLNAAAIFIRYRMRKKITW